MGLFVPLILLVISTYALARIVYNLFFHPLSHVPGPFLCRISSIPSFYHACKGDRHIWLWQQFQLYGPKVRAAPNLLLFNTPSAYNSIYSAKSNFKKSKFYLAWRRNTADVNTLTIPDPVEHARRKKNLSVAFTDKSVKAAEPFVRRHVDRWDELLLASEGGKEAWKGQEEGWTKPKNAATWVSYLIFDILTDLAFGESAEVKEPGENHFREIPFFVGKFMAFVYPIAKSPLLNLLLYLKPRGLDALLDMLTPANVKAYYNFLSACVSRRVESEKLRAITKASAEREDMYHFLCTARNPDTGELLFTPDILLAEANLLIVAGYDTSSATLSSLIFYLTRNPRVYAKLCAELRDTFSSIEHIVNGPQLASCKYLRACIDETLRISAPGPSEFEREIMKGGAYIDGDFYPEGMIVGTPSWALFRNEEVYGDVSTFRPERWLVSEHPDTLNTPEDVLRLRRGFHPFQKGAGMCLGMNFATMVLSLALARTLYRMDVRAAPGETLGEGREDLGWGQRDPKQYVLRDAFIAERDGPVVQFRPRTL